MQRPSPLHDASDAPVARAHDGERTGDLRAPLRARPLGLLAGGRLDKQIYDEVGEPERNALGRKWAEKHDKTTVMEEAFHAAAGRFMDKQKQ